MSLGHMKSGLDHLYSGAVVLPPCLTLGPLSSNGERCWRPLRVVPGSHFKDVIRSLFEGATGDSDRPKGYLYLGKACASEQLEQAITDLTKEMKLLHAGDWPHVYGKPAPWLTAVWDIYRLDTDLSGMEVLGNDEFFSIWLRGKWSESFTVERSILHARHTNLVVNP